MIPGIKRTNLAWVCKRSRQGRRVVPGGTSAKGHGHVQMSVTAMLGSGIRLTPREKGTIMDGYAFAQRHAGQRFRRKYNDRSLIASG